MIDEKAKEIILADYCRKYVNCSSYDVIHCRLRDKCPIFKYFIYKYSDDKGVVIYEFKNKTRIR